MNGLHWADGGIAFLIQGPNVQNALNMALDCPFPAERETTHRIDLQTMQASHDFPSHPLVDAMSPVPKAPGDQIVFLTAGPNDKTILATLARMSSPTRVPMRPMWSMEPRHLLGLLDETNVQTLVLCDIGLDDRKKLDRVIETAESSPRKILLHGNPQVILPPTVTRTRVPTWHLPDVVALPWEAHGATLLRNHMRNQ